jgi:hypothetical protein
VVARTTLSLRAIAIVVAFAALPLNAIAACAGDNKPSYSDITAIDFRSQGLTEPGVLRSDRPVGAGACPVSVALYVTPSFDDMGGGPVCYKDASGKVQHCCGATLSRTDDPPLSIFSRLVAALQKDGFYDQPETGQASPPPDGAFFSLAVMRCGDQPRSKGFSMAFGGPPKARPNTAIVALTFPYGSLPTSLYAAKTLTLFEDVTQAVYQSKWSLTDVY